MYALNGLGDVDPGIYDARLANRYSPEMGSWLSKTIKRNSKEISVIAPIAAAFIPGVGLLAAAAVSAGLKAYNAQQAAAEVKKLNKQQVSAVVNSPPAEWDEKSYLAANADVAAAITAGTWKGSGWAHYVQYGANENRTLKPAVVQTAPAAGQPAQTVSTAIPAGWNDAAYLAANPDVAAAIKAGTWKATGWIHWQTYGQKEKRNNGQSPPEAAKPVVSTTAKPAVAAAKPATAAKSLVAAPARAFAAAASPASSQSAGGGSSMSMALPLFGAAALILLMSKR